MVRMEKTGKHVWRLQEILDPPLMISSERERLVLQGR